MSTGDGGDGFSLPCVDVDFVNLRIAREFGHGKVKVAIVEERNTSAFRARRDEVRVGQQVGLVVVVEPKIASPCRQRQTGGRV